MLCATVDLQQESERDDDRVEIPSGARRTERHEAGALNCVRNDTKVSTLNPSGPCMLLPGPALVAVVTASYCGLFSQEVQVPQKRSHRRILIVEDDPIVAFSQKSMDSDRSRIEFETGR